MIGDFGEQLITKELQEMNLEKLHNAIAAVCPINGISIGNASDKTTWTFKALETATTEQITAAQSVIDNADLSILDDTKFITKVTAYNRIEEKYGEEKLNQIFDILDSLDRKNRRIYDDAQDIDCSNALVISMLQSIGINPEDILY